MIADIPEEENFSAKFNRRIITDICVDNVGYNNFRFVEGCRAKRSEEHYTMHFILSGKGTLNVGGNTYKLCGKDVFFCMPNELFSYYPDESDPWEYVWFGFYGDKSDDVLHAMGLSSDNYILKNVVSDSVISKLSSLLANIRKNQNINSISLLSSFFGILSEFEIKENEPVSRENIAHRYVERAKNCIENNFFDPEFRIEHVGQLLFLNHTYLCRLFVNETGITMIGYLRERRLDAAKKLLASTSKTVREISLECGFGDYPHFCKMFLSETGFTPSGYREKNKKYV